MFYGVNALLTRWAESIGPLIAFAVLMVTNYAPGATTIAAQPPEAVLGIKFIFYGIVNILVLMSLIFVYLFPLDGEKLTELAQEWSDNDSGELITRSIFVERIKLELVWL